MIRHAWQRAVFHAAVAAWFAVVYWLGPMLGRLVAEYAGTNAP